MYIYILQVLPLITLGYLNVILNMNMMLYLCLSYRPLYVLK